MLPAIEASAQQWTSLIYGAPLGSEVHTRAFRRCSQQKHLAPITAGGNPELVRLDLVALFGMQKESLITAAALSATRARHFGLLRNSQTTV